MENLPAYAISLLVAGAAGFLAWRLLRGQADPAERPAGGRALAAFGPNVRLRDLYRLAVLLEEEGIAFYLKLAERAKDPAARKLCAGLADAEVEHRELFQSRLDRWRELPPNRAEWPGFVEKAKAEGFFAGAPGDGASEEEMAAFAIKQERLSADFYRMFEEAFPDAWKKEKLQDLVRQELAHEEKLRAAYPAIR